MSGDVAFAGRGPELAAVVDVMVSSRRAVAVTGDAGVGKSRLVLEASARAAQLGAVVLRGQCLSLATSLPLLPFLDVLRELADLENGQLWSSILKGCPSSVRHEVERLLPESVEQTATADRSADSDWQRGRLFDAVRRVLTSAASRGVAIVIEDVQWADHATVDLLEYLLSPSHNVPIPIVLTFRTNDPVSSDAEAWLRHLPQVPAMSVLALTPLQFVDAATLIRSLAGRDLPMADLQMLYERSEGNPFFIEQLVQSLVELGAGGSTSRLPDGLAALLLYRTESVTGSARAVMQCLAVAEGDVDEAFLADCCAEPLPATRQALRLLADRRLLRPDRDLGLRLAHALLAEAITGSLLPEEVREWHQRIAEAMARIGSIEAAGTVAEHFCHAGLDDQELRWRIAAGRRSQEVFARAEAARHWTRAVSLLESPHPAAVPEGTTPAEIYARAAIALKLAGDHAGATALAQRGLDRFGEDADLATRAALLTGFSYDPRNGDPQIVRDAMKQALEIYEQLPPDGVYLRATHDYFWVSNQRSGQSEAAAAALDRALAVAPDLHAPMPHFLLSMDRAWVDMSQGNLDAALDRLSKAHRLTEIIDDPIPRISVAASKTDILLKTGRLHEVLPLAEELGAWLTDPIQNDEATAALRSNVFGALTELGDIERAGAVIDPVTEGIPQPKTWHSYAARAKLEMLRGRLKESEERWNALPHLTDPDTDCEIEPWRLELKLWLRQPEIALNQAVDILTRLIDTSDTRASGRLLLVAIRSHADMARLPTRANGRPSTAEIAETLKSLHTRMSEDPLSPGPLRPTADADGLMWEAEWLRANGVTESALWETAAAAYEEYNRRHLAAYARLRQAEALLAHKERRRAAAALSEADQLGSQHVPLRAVIAKVASRAHIRLDNLAHQPVPATPHPFGLTNREIAVLELVCHGDTNASIASKLFISEKTASVHVSNILRKLDVSTRVQAANVAEQIELFAEKD
jgi:ATP/maltotriose-dependent transcriptional regulator MalT